MSGHIFFADTFYGFDDALYCGLRLLNIVANSKESLAEMRDGLPQPVNTPELRFDCPDERKFGVVEEVKARLQEGRRQVLRHRRRARQHQGRLVAAARLEHPARAGGALRGARRGGAAAADERPEGAHLKAASACLTSRAASHLPRRRLGRSLRPHRRLEVRSALLLLRHVARSRRHGAGDRPAPAARGVRAGDACRPCAAARQGGELSDRRSAIPAARCGARWSAA